MRGRAVSAATTKHALIANQIRQQIASGELKPGERVPTIAQLVERTGIGRDAVLKGLDTLRGEGLIVEASRGRGHEVASRQLIEFDPLNAQKLGTRRAAGTDTWVTQLNAQGYRAEQEITVSNEKVGGEVAELLGLAPGKVVVMRRRVRYVDGEPHSLENSAYPPEIADRAPRAKLPEDVPEGVVAYMASLGIVQVRYQDWTECRMPTKEEARLLDLERLPGVPVLVETRTGYEDSGRPVRVTVTVSRGDRTRIVSKVEAR
jgi:GntR family transcriptional regulator